MRSSRASSRADFLVSAKLRYTVSGMNSARRRKGMGGHTILQRCQEYQGPFISRSDISIDTKKYPQKIPHLLSLHQSKISVNEPPLPPPPQTGKRETHLGIRTVDTTRSFSRVTAHETVLIEQ